jgi:arylsulfatase B
MHVTDWLPTLYRAAGGNPEELGSLDGFDQWQSLSGIETSSPRTEMLYNIFPPNFPISGAAYR